MISIVSHGIMGTAYRQDVVVDEGIIENGSLQVLHDIRRHLSTQYGDDTPMTGWALQPAPAGMWLSHIERAFDSNYAPGYVMVSFLIPQGRRLLPKAMQSIEHCLVVNHAKFMQQSVVLHRPDWGFLHLLGQELNGMFDESVVGEEIHHVEYGTTNEIAYYSGEITTMLYNMWDYKFRRFGIIFCGKGLLSESRKVVSIDGLTSEEDSTNKEDKTEKKRYEGSVEKAEDVTSSRIGMADASHGGDNNASYNSKTVSKTREEKRYKIPKWKCRDKDKRRIKESIVSSFCFKGKIGRMQYCMTLYGVIPLLFIFFIFMGINSYLVYFEFVFVLPMLWLLFSQGAKRCHDLGRSGWFQLVPFYVFPMMFKREDKSSRKYTKDIVLIIVAALVALIVPISTTGLVNQIVSEITSQWYLSGTSRVIITVMMTIVTYLLSFLIIRRTIMKKSIIFIVISLFWTFIWCVVAGLVYMPLD